MRRIVTAAILALAASCATEAPPTGNEVHSDISTALQGKRLMFLGAHPDDETVLMPIFAEACLFNGATCHFVSATTAEMGCLGPMGWNDFEKCTAHRMKELEASAAIVNGTSEFLDWQDLFYAHDGEGLRRNLTRWEQTQGGHDNLVDDIANLLAEHRPDVVFGLDPRHGATCNPNHRAVSLLLVEAVGRLPAEHRPRVLFENTYSVFEHMTPEMMEAAERGAIYPWPAPGDANIYYDGSRLLPNGRRAIDYQLDALRAHPTQFPDLPEDIAIEAAPAQLMIPLIDLADIDPTEELCAPLDLSNYKTIDRTLSYTGAKLAALAGDEQAPHAFRLTHKGEIVGEYGDLDAWPGRVESDFPDAGVSLVVTAASVEEAEAVRASYLQQVMRFVEAPE